MNVETYYPGPFENHMSKVFTKDSSAAFDFPLHFIYPNAYKFSQLDKDKIVNRLNNKSIETLDLGEKFLKYDEITSTIYLTFQEISIPFIIIRGWGHLTSPNRFDLSNQEAKEVQKQFAELIIKKLSK
jgi:hypothetical protein